MLAWLRAVLNSASDHIFSLKPVLKRNPSVTHRYALIRFQIRFLFKTAVWNYGFIESWSHPLKQCTWMRSSGLVAKQRLFVSFSTFSCKNTNPRTCLRCACLSVLVNSSSMCWLCVFSATAPSRRRRGWRNSVSGAHPRLWWGRCRKISVRRRRPSADPQHARVLPVEMDSVGGWAGKQEGVRAVGPRHQGQAPDCQLANIHPHRTNTESQICWILVPGLFYAV